MHISNNINGILRENFPENFSDEFLKRPDLYNILKNIQSIIINNGEISEIKNFGSFSDEDKKFLNLIFSGGFTKLEVLKKIEKYIFNQEEVINNDNNKIFQSIISFCNKGLNYTIFSLGGISNDLKNFEGTKLRGGSSEDLSVVNNLENLIKYFGEKFVIINNILVKKDEKIIDLTSKNNYLEGENFDLKEKNIDLDDKNFDLLEKKFLSDKEKKFLEDKISFQNKEILNLKNSKEKIKKSRKNILQENKNLEEEIKNLEYKNNFFGKLNIFKTRKIKSLKEELERKNNLIREKDLIIEKINLTIKEKDAKLISFQNLVNELEIQLIQKDEEVLGLKSDLKDEKDENLRLGFENDGLKDEKNELILKNQKLENENFELEGKASEFENQLIVYAKTLKEVLRKKQEKEKKLKESLEKTKSLKERMKNKLKK